MLYSNSTDSSDNQSNSSIQMGELLGSMDAILQRNQNLYALRLARDLRMQYYGISPPANEPLPSNQEEFIQETTQILNILAQLDQINLGANQQTFRDVTMPIEAEQTNQHIRQQTDTNPLLFQNFQMQQQITRSQQKVAEPQINISPPVQTGSYGCCK